MIPTMRAHRKLYASFMSCALILAAGVTSTVDARQAGLQQQAFAAPADAVAALVDALRKDDLRTLASVLGPGSTEIINSGDPIADKNARDDFLAAHSLKSNLVARNPNTTVLEIGEDAWPFPISLVRTERGWRFDTEAGRTELLNRRIGRNEANAIQASLAVIDAQREYASADRDGDGILEYAQRFRSMSGMKDGLYWPAQGAEPPSPLGALFAAAEAEGYRIPAPGVATDTPAPSNPYYGYYFKILIAQGPAAVGGAYDYLVGGNLIGGVAMIAYPAQYGVSGIMSFIVNHDGVVYQKDLGFETQDAALATSAFNPDETWQRADFPTPVAAAP